MDLLRFVRLSAGELLSNVLRESESPKQILSKVAIVYTVILVLYLCLLYVCTVAEKIRVRSTVLDHVSSQFRFPSAQPKARKLHKCVAVVVDILQQLDQQADITIWTA